MSSSQITQPEDLGHKMKFSSLFHNENLGVSQISDHILTSESNVYSGDRGKLLGVIRPAKC